MSKFPCRECLVRACCTNHCDKLITDGRTLALFLTIYQTCPDCGFQVCISSEETVFVCEVCRKVFKKRRHATVEHQSIQTKSASSSTSNVMIHRTRNIAESNIYTGIGKYYNLDQLKPAIGKNPKIEWINTEKKSETHIECVRLSSIHSKHFIELNSHTIHWALVEKPGLNKIKPIPEWVNNHSDLFIRSQDDDY
jgi:hypothetical protein